MNPLSGRMTSHQSEHQRILTLLKNLRDLTIHCLQLVQDEDQEELSFWLIRRRACMVEIDQVQELAGIQPKQVAGVSTLEPISGEIHALLRAIETLDQELLLVSQAKRDHYQENLRQLHTTPGNLVPSTAHATTGRYLDRIG